ncbi:MAG: hypothetical protein ABIQ01_01735 [Pseudolysinimonas sp.]
MRRRTAVALTTGFVGMALALSLLVPSEEFQQGPYVGTIPALDTRADSREFSVTVTGARLADRVQTPEWTGTTPGVWLVVDIVFERRIDHGPITGAFRIGDVEYLLSTRPDDASIDGGASSQPGIPWAGSMLIELPLAALDDPDAGVSVLRFATQSDPRLDGVLDYTIDLGSLDHESSISIFEPERVAP